MNEQTQNGGWNVFPKAITSGDKSISDGGLLLRDYFAAQALAGVIFANSKTDSEIFAMMKAEDSKQQFELIPKHCAESAYKYADAMMKARATISAT